MDSPRGIEHRWWPPQRQRSCFACLGRELRGFKEGGGRRQDRERQRKARRLKAARRSSKKQQEKQSREDDQSSKKKRVKDKAAQEEAEGGVVGRGNKRQVEEKADIEASEKRPRQDKEEAERGMLTRRAMR